MAQRVVVVGAGVIGLSCAVRLAEAGYDTHVVARDLPRETTSAVAGGLWLPYLSGPAEAVARWGRTTFTELTRIHDEDDAAGVLLSDGLLLHRCGTRTTPPLPPWHAAAAGLVPLSLVTAPRPGYASAWALRVPLVDTTRYLPWLAARLEAAGGTITRASLTALPRHGVVVDATGVRAHALAGDPTVEPVRGQVVVVENPGLSTWWVDEADPLGPVYVLPRGDHVVVGGTADAGRWDTDPDAEVADRLLRRAEQVEPSLAGARVLAHRVGLRPSRPEVRLETERHRDGAVVHCYGHGGSGYTLSWGCADDVLAEVRAVSGSPDAGPTP